MPFRQTYAFCSPNKRLQIAWKYNEQLLVNMLRQAQHDTQENCFHEPAASATQGRNFNSGPEKKMTHLME
jgi:hypothetical protein